MTPEKKPDQTSKPSTPATEGARKSWVPKSPIEVMLDLVTKQERKVGDLQIELDSEKAMLAKLLQAKKSLEAT